MIKIFWSVQLFLFTLVALCACVGNIATKKNVFLKMQAAFTHAQVFFKKTKQQAFWLDVRTRSELASWFLRGLGKRFNARRSLGDRSAHMKETNAKTTIDFLYVCHETILIGYFLDMSQLVSHIICETWASVIYLSSLLNLEWEE